MKVAELVYYATDFCVKSHYAFLPTLSSKQNTVTLLAIIKKSFLQANLQLTCKIISLNHVVYETLIVQSDFDICLSPL